MGKEENIEVFKDTERQCREDGRLKLSVKNSIGKQKLILETDKVSVGNLKKNETRAKVIVSQKRTFEAASAYKGKKVAVLNFASASNPGGGVTKGSTAQEECLCRGSTLYFALDEQTMWNGFYKPHRAAHNPIHNDDIIFTPSVTVFKTDTSYPKMMNPDEWYDVDVITCAAPNLRSDPSNGYNPDDGEAVKVSDDELKAIHEKRLRRILDVAVSEGCEVVILGAFGCGAFRNDPRIVAAAAKKVLPDYIYAFDVIEYAIYSGRRDTGNYDAFKNALFRF